MLDLLTDEEKKEIKKLVSTRDKVRRKEKELTLKIKSIKARHTTRLNQSKTNTGSCYKIDIVAEHPIEITFSSDELDNSDSLLLLTKVFGEPINPINDGYVRVPFKNLLIFCDGRLTMKELFVVYHRFYKDERLDKIGILLGLTRERIRQIEDSSIRKIKHPVIGRKIKEFYNID